MPCGGTSLVVDPAPRHSSYRTTAEHILYNAAILTHSRNGSRVPRPHASNQYSSTAGSLSHDCYQGIVAAPFLQLSQLRLNLVELRLQQRIVISQVAVPPLRLRQLLAIEALHADTCC
jgi:hypothetical protein